MTILRGPRVLLRPVSEADAEPLRAIRREPSVARWWAPEEAPTWPLDDDPDVRTWSIVVDDEVVGLIQDYAEDDPEFRHAGVDLFLATAAQDRGLGPEAIRLVLRYLIDVDGHHRVVIDPAAANARAIAAYEKLGFRRVGTMRGYWRDHVEGVWADGLLLDLLAEDLVG